jgi:sulfate transport system substrate-binding protein
MTSTRDSKEPPLLASRRHAAWTFIAVVAVIGFLIAWLWPFRSENELLNVAYDSTRVYFSDVNAAFSEIRQKEGNENRVRTTHAGSLRQVDAISNGLMADVLCLSSSVEVDSISIKTGCISPDWQERLPFRSSPFTTTVVMLVQKGNPREVGDWADLWRPDLRVVMPSPESSGAGRHAYLALVADAMDRHAGDPRQALVAMRELFLGVRLVNLGAHQAFQVFDRNKLGDVYLTWESEALRIAGPPDTAYEIVYPKRSLLAEPVVAMMDCHVEKRGTRGQAVAYLDFLYSPEGQTIAAKDGLRPRAPDVARQYAATFHPIELVSVEDVFGYRVDAWEAHFGKDGTFESILRLKAAATGGVE